MSDVENLEIVIDDISKPNNRLENRKQKDATVLGQHQQSFHEIDYNTDRQMEATIEYQAKAYRDIMTFDSKYFKFVIVLAMIVGALIVLYYFENMYVENAVMEKRYVTYMIAPIYVIIFVMLLLFRRDRKITMFTALIMCILIGYILGLITKLLLDKGMEIPKDLHAVDSYVR